MVAAGDDDDDNDDDNDKNERNDRRRRRAPELSVRDKRERVRELFLVLIQRSPTEAEVDEYVAAASDGDGDVKDSLILKKILRDHALLPGGGSGGGISSSSRGSRGWSSGDNDVWRMSSLFDADIQGGAGREQSGSGDGGVVGDGPVCCYAPVDLDSRLLPKSDARCKTLDLRGRVCLDKDDVLRRLRSIARNVNDFYSIVQNV